MKAHAYLLRFDRIADLAAFHEQGEGKHCASDSVDRFRTNL